MSRPPLLILGWDGADWGFIDLLMLRGGLPHLASLLQRGSRADLASLEPRLSPLLWTSAVTGVTPDRHGVLNFVEPSPDGQGLRLASSTSRRCRALWNLCHLRGLRSHVVNWYATHPAEPIDGVVLSNQFFQASEPPVDSVHPAAHRLPMLELLQAAAPEVRACRHRILPHPAQCRQAEDGPLIAALGAAAERAASIHRLSLALASRHDWDALLLFHEWIDVAGHHAMAYAPPRQEHISARQQRLFGGVIEAVYREQDRMLGELLAAVGEEVNVILLSDHGFHHGASRPRLSGVALGDDRAEQEASWHRPLGILAMAGPGVRPGATSATASLLDITPTALALLGLPAGADMDGRVLQELLVADAPAPLPSWEAVVGEAGEHPADLRLDPFEAHEAVQQLIALGYLAAMPPGQADRVAFVRRETAFNRALVLARSGRPVAAIPLLEALVEQQPRQVRFALLLLECLMTSGDMAGAVRHGEAFLDRQPLASDLRLGLILALLELERLPEVEQQLQLIRPETCLHHLSLGEIQARLNRPALAEAHFREALRGESTAIQGHLGLARLALARGAAEQAAEHCLDAQALSLRVPEAHLLLALCLAWLGMDGQACLSCQHALALFPCSRAALLLHAVLASRCGEIAAADHSRQRLLALVDPAAAPGDAPASGGTTASGTSAGPPVDSAQPGFPLPRERLLDPVMHWIRHHHLPSPLDLDRL